MKKIETYLNEKEYAKFILKCARQGKTPYAKLKELVLDFLSSN
jgi:hypothetical protein